MKQKHKQTIYHANVNIDLMEENLIQNQWCNNDKCLCECKKTSSI